jgi:hypothetical protein
MQPAPPPTPETDPRFPSGPWTGFFLDRRMPGRHAMDLRLEFRDGLMNGDGRDRVGQFLIRGRYSVDDGQCHWVKQYIGQHNIFYKGYNEGKGIWGTWELVVAGASASGGFHIWPEGEADPTRPHLEEAIDQPVEELAAAPA